MEMAVPPAHGQTLRPPPFATSPVPHDVPVPPWRQRCARCGGTVSRSRWEEKEPAPPRSPGWFPLPTVGARAPRHGRWSRFSIRVSSGDRRVHPTSQHPRAVPGPRADATRPSQHRSPTPGARPWLSAGASLLALLGGGKKEQGEREVLTRAARDIAGLGLQLGALAGFPSVPRGHAPPRPGPGPSPAGHRAQAPRGPLLPHAVNCNTAQPHRPTLPAPRGAPASSSWHRGVLAVADPSCPGAPWQSRARSLASLRVPPAPLAPPSHPSPNPKGPRAGSAATTTPCPAPASLLGSRHRRHTSPLTHARPGSPQPVSTHRARSPLTRVAPTGAQLTREGSGDPHGARAS